MSEKFIDLSAFDQSERFKMLDRFLTENISKHKRFTAHPDLFNGRASARDFSFLKFIDVETTPYKSSIDQEILSIPGRAERLILTMPIKGNFNVEQNGYSGILEPGNLALLDNRMIGSISGIGESENLLMSVPRSTWSNLASIPALDDCFRLDMNRTISRIVRHYMMELSHAETDVNTNQKASLARQMIETITAATNDFASFQAETAHQQLMIINIKSFIRSNIGIKPININTVSNQFGISSRYISLIFSKSGQVMKQYISDIRMQMALELLEKSLFDKTSINEISARLGYYSQSHFSNAFAARYGMSPSAYRESISR
jgi:AraC family transcriptional activator of tynA and feaB